MLQQRFPGLGRYQAPGGDDPDDDRQPGQQRKKHRAAAGTQAVRRLFLLQQDRAVGRASVAVSAPKFFWQTIPSLLTTKFITPVSPYFVGQAIRPQPSVIRPFRM